MVGWKPDEQYTFCHVFLMLFFNYSFFIGSGIRHHPTFLSAGVQPLNNAVGNFRVLNI